MITVTDKAVAEAKRVMEDQGIPLDEHALAVRVKGGGCSGFQYHMEFVKLKEVNSLNETVYNFGGLSVVVDGRSDLYLNGTEVDFQDTIDKRGFKFVNPNSKGCCGCGSSFTT